MSKILMAIALLLSLAACDPFKAKFQTFVNQDIREVEAFYGPVWDAYDRNDGVRVFQWGRVGPYIRPTIPADNYNARLYQNSPFYNPVTVLGNVNAHHLRCWYSVAARWHDELNAWIVEEVETPADRCEP